MNMAPRKPRRDYWGWIFIAPSFLILLVCYLIPIVMNVVFSFTAYNVIQPPRFVGFANYLRMANDRYLGIALRNTLVYTALVVPLQTGFSLAFAIVLAGVCGTRWGRLIKGALFIPVITSMVLVGAIWRIFLATDGGMINYLLGLFGVSPVNWLGGTRSSMLSIAMVAIWKSVGYFLVIFFAGVMDIPRVLYEAAVVDGANWFRKLTHITLPMLKPITYLVVTLGTIWSFQVFDLVYVMTGGGPGFATTTLVLSIYNTAFREFRMGRAGAISMLLLVIIFIVSYLRKKGFRHD